MSNNPHLQVLENLPIITVIILVWPCNVCNVTINTAYFVESFGWSILLGIWGSAYLFLHFDANCSLNVLRAVCVAACNALKHLCMNTSVMTEPGKLPNEVLQLIMGEMLKRQPPSSETRWQHTRTHPRSPRFRAWALSIALHVMCKHRCWRFTSVWWCA